MMVHRAAAGFWGQNPGFKSLKMDILHFCPVHGPSLPLLQNIVLSTNAFLVFLHVSQELSLPKELVLFLPGPYHPEPLINYSPDSVLPLVSHTL